MPMRLGGLSSGLDTDAIVKEMMSAQTMKKTKIEQDKEKLEWKKEKWGEMNTKVYSLYTEKLSNLKLEGTYLAKKIASSDEFTASASVTTAATGVYTLSVEKLATSQFVTGADISDKKLSKESKLTDAGMTAGQIITVKTGKSLDTEKTIEIKSDTTVAHFVEALKGAGLNASFDETNGRFYISSKESGLENKFTLESNASGEGGLEAIGLENITDALATSGRKAGDKSVVAVLAAGDLEAELNGAKIHQSGNTITAAGLTIEVKNTTSVGQTVNFSVTNDTDGVYDKVKDFVKSYNELIETIYKTLNAPSAKGYNMLTQDEKDSMSEKQVELWEGRIKDSLLRRDSQLTDVMSAMRNSMQESIEIDGKNYSLVSFGIVTGAYTENGILHIKGDEEDGLYKDEEDSLRKALTENPEVVSKVMSKVMGKLYEKLNSMMMPNNISSALTLYNDKQMKTQIDKYQKEIDDWSKRLQDMEDRYYKQFATMESSLANMQAKQNQLAGMMGITQ